MKANQVETFHQEVQELFQRYGVRENFVLTYIMIDDETGAISIPSIAHASAIPDYSVSKPRAVGNLAENMMDTLVSLLRKYSGLDIFGSVGALKGMLAQVQGTQLQQEHVREMRRRTTTPLA